MGAQHQDVLQVEGLHLADRQAVVHRVHKVVLIVHVRTGQRLIVQDQMRLGVADPIVPAPRVLESLNLQQTEAIAPFHPVLRWVDRMIPRAFVHELLNP